MLDGFGKVVWDVLGICLGSCWEFGLSVRKVFGGRHGGYVVVSPGEFRELSERVLEDKAYKKSMSKKLVKPIRNLFESFRTY